MLIFNDHTLSSSSSSSCSAVPVSSRCMSEDELKSRTDKFVGKYGNKVDDFRPDDTSKTCKEAALEMRGEANRRSLSPWRYRLDRKDDRFPRDIYMAECLCQGCINEQQEDMSYNSVPVHAALTVLTKITCPHDSNKYKLKKEIIKVPVACTCVVPRNY
ncbi:Interleukin-17C [Nibea albiflora]|uniref:Interleukin-17C n=1 Tax=Nibea albiflora TaxID=240163 RepID=A0ACB7EHA6_NIBAL|nr:Interleukin-17C [Nibea albiflora]